MIDINLMMIYNFQTHSGVCNTLGWAHAINRTVRGHRRRFHHADCCHRKFLPSALGGNKECAVDSILCSGPSTGWQNVLSEDNVQGCSRHLLFFAVVSNVFSALVLHFIELYTQPTFELLTVQHSKSVLRDVQTLCEDLGGKDFSLQFHTGKRPCL